MKRHLAYQFGSIIAVLAMTAGAQAAGIAIVTDVVNEGYRTPPGSEEMAARRADELIQNEALRTDDDSSMRVKFVDGSELGVESASEVVLSNYVFDGAAAEGLINLNNGLFHFTSNGKDDQRVQLRTPVATIGIRGTEFMVHVDRDNATVIDILSGAVEAKPAIVLLGAQPFVRVRIRVGDDERAAGLERPDHLPDRAWRIRRVVQHHVGEHRVHFAVRERQRIHLPGTRLEVASGEPRTHLIQHAFGNVDADHPGVGVERGLGEESGPGADVGDDGA